MTPEPRNEAAERLTECRHARVWRPLPDEPIWECEQCGEPFAAERAAPKVDAEFVSLEIALGWALGYIEYRGVVPSPDEDEREGDSDLMMWRDAQDTVARIARLAEYARLAGED